MTRTADENHLEILGLDHTVEMDVNEVETRSSTPVSEEPGLDVFQLQGFLQQGIIKEIDLSNGEVVGRIPISVHGLEIFLGERLAHDVLLPSVLGF